MSNDSGFGYLKANTMLFAQKVCRAFYDMGGGQFIIVKETLREGPFCTSYPIVAFIEFSGGILGNYSIALETATAEKLVGGIISKPPADAVRDHREEYGGYLKEVLNVAVGQAIEELEKSFYELTFMPCTIVYGEIEFPSFQSGTIEIEAREGRVLCGFSLNFAQLKIGGKLEETIEELRKQSAEVREIRRTTDAILELLPVGLMAIDREGIVLPGYSKSTLSVAGLPDGFIPAGKPLFDCVGAPESFHSEWNNWLKLVFQKFGQLPFDEMTQLCILDEFTNGNGKPLTCTWLPVPETGGTGLDKLLVMIEDRSREAELKLRMDEVNTRHRENVDMVASIINLQPDEVTDFIYDSSSLLENAQLVVERNDVDRDLINELFRTFHTLKGTSGQYNFTALQELAHKVEDHLVVYRDNGEKITGSAIDAVRLSIESARGYIDRIRNVRSKLGAREETLKEKAGRDPDSVTVSLHDIDEIVQRLSELMEAGGAGGDEISFIENIAPIRNKVAALRKIDLGFFAESFQSLIKNTSAKTGKKAHLAIGHNLKVDISIMRKLHHSLIHLLNNAIAHGIEYPAERTRIGKIETGVITLSGVQNGTAVEISVADDGRGIDLKKVREMVVERYGKTIEEVRNMKEHEVYGYLLEPGFSTKSAITEISGRGVGMDAVKNSIKDLDGTISIRSTRGSGTVITLSIPLNSAVTG
jgi:signal transduction histidine kinase/CheY-specific phosphatase CheX